MKLKVFNIMIMIKSPEETWNEARKEKTQGKFMHYNNKNKRKIQSEM